MQRAVHCCTCSGHLSSMPAAVQKQEAVAVPQPALRHLQGLGDQVGQEVRVHGEQAAQAQGKGIWAVAPESEAWGLWTGGHGLCQRAAMHSCCSTFWAVWVSRWPVLERPLTAAHSIAIDTPWHLLKALPAVNATVNMAFTQGLACCQCCCQHVLPLLTWLPPVGAAASLCRRAEAQACRCTCGRWGQAWCSRSRRAAPLATARGKAHLQVSGYYVK